MDKVEAFCKEYNIMMHYDEVLDYYMFNDYDQLIFWSVVLDKDTFDQDAFIGHMKERFNITD